jgi:hypothetical protein
MSLALFANGNLKNSAYELILERLKVYRLFEKLQAPNYFNLHFQKGFNILGEF